MDYLIFHFFLILLLMVFSAFFSGSETALFSLKKADLHRFSTSSNYVERSIAASMMHPDKILITILLGNLFVNIMLSSLTTSIMLRYFTSYGHIISIIVITPLVIIFCEITPKIIAIYFHNKFSKISFPFLQIFHKAVSPFRKIILFFTDIIIRSFSLELKHNIITEDELDHVVEKGKEQGIIDKKEGDIIKNVMRFSKREASNIMYPRNHAIFIPEGCTVKNAMKIIEENDIVRVPVYRKDLDDIAGVIDARDIISSYLGYTRSNNIDKFIRPVDFFPFSKDLDELLSDFLEKKIQIAVIVDEYGGTAGIATLNSILSAILGKEFGNWESYRKNEVRSVAENRFIVYGEMQLDEFNSFFESDFESNNSDTIGGYLIEKFENFPEKGDVIKFDDLEIKIRNIKKRKIERVEIFSEKRELK